MSRFPRVGVPPTAFSRVGSASGDTPTGVPAPSEGDEGASFGAVTLCPCGSGVRYDRCCGALHRGERVAVTAEELMRSRYTAYVVGDSDYLARTWHARTRPDRIDASDGPDWTGLEIVDAVAGGADDADGVVEFVARFRDARGRPDALRERSRFTRRGGRWVYVDGDLFGP